MVASTRSRRSFLLKTGSLLGAAWVSAHWPDIASAAHHAATSNASTRLAVLSPAEATEVEAIAAQIIPSGSTPGAREAHVVNFIDRALAAFFAPLAPELHAALAQFSGDFQKQQPGTKVFSAAPGPTQIAYLRSIESTPFFQTMRFLTVLGFLSSPKYGGNAQGLGWKAIGFKDEHVFAPPFGYYDREYTGFVPYTPEKVS